MVETVLDEALPVRPELPRLVDLKAGSTTEIRMPTVRLVNIRGSILAEDTGEPLQGIKLHVYYGQFRQNFKFNAAAFLRHFFDSTCLK